MMVKPDRTNFCSISGTRGRFMGQVRLGNSFEDGAGKIRDWVGSKYRKLKLSRRSKRVNVGGSKVSGVQPPTAAEPPFCTLSKILADSVNDACQTNWTSSLLGQMLKRFQVVRPRLSSSIRVMSSTTGFPHLVVDNCEETVDNCEFL